MEVYAGEFKKIYDPSEGENEAWYINDHTIVKGEDGWHLFGITHKEPASPIEEVLCAHAFTTDLINVPFTKQPYPLSADKNANELLIPENNRQTAPVPDEVLLEDWPLKNLLRLAVMTLFSAAVNSDSFRYILKSFL